MKKENEYIYVKKKDLSKSVISTLIFGFFFTNAYTLITTLNMLNIEPSMIPQRIYFNTSIAIILGLVSFGYMVHSWMDTILE